METNLCVEILPVLQDNYIFLLHDKDSAKTAVVDPAEATPVLNILKRYSWKLDYIWNTHHHSDHVGGNLELKRETHCSIIGSAKDSSRIPGIDIELKESDSFKLGPHTIKILETPGHTNGAISFWVPTESLLFCGDTLFSMGCGRLFEGSPQSMWTSLEKIKALPAETKIYCTHEYTLANGEFALSVDPDNIAIHQRIAQVKSLRKQNLPSIPSLLSIEKKINPFLRADNPILRMSLGMEHHEDWEVFAKLRSSKDSFS